MHPASFFNFIVEKLSQLASKSIPVLNFKALVFGPINNIFNWTIFCIDKTKKNIIRGLQLVIFSLQANTVHIMYNTYTVLSFTIMQTLLEAS